MKTIPLLLLAACLITPVRADEVIVRTVETSAAPLQCYRALCEDWIFLQWSEAQSANFGMAAGAPWRVHYAPADLEEGILRTLEPGVILEYTQLSEENFETIVRFDFESTDYGTKLRLTHTIPFGGGRALKLSALFGEAWEQRLRRLTTYLDSRPGSYLVTPPGAGPYPAVILLHDRFGLTSPLRSLADSLALRGFVVCAVDMFKGDRTSDLTQAAHFLTLVNDNQALAALGSVWRALTALPVVNARRMATLGLGYGGRLALRAVAAEPSLRGAVAWYPDQLPEDSLLPRIAAPVMIVHAGPSLEQPSPQAEAISQRLIQNGVHAENVLLKAEPGFAESGYGAAFSAPTVNDAMRLTLGFLDRRLKI